MERNSLMHTESVNDNRALNEVDLTELVDETIVEGIWNDLDGQIDRDQVREVAFDVAHEFTNATVTAFIPLFIRRRAYERLKPLVD